MPVVTTRPASRFAATWPHGGVAAPGPCRKPRACPLYARLAAPGHEPGSATARGSGAHAVRHAVWHRRAISMQCGEGGGGHQPHPDPDCPLVHVEHGLVDIEVGA